MQYRAHVQAMEWRAQTCAIARVGFNCCLQGIQPLRQAVAKAVQAVAKAVQAVAKAGQAVAKAVQAIQPLQND